MPIRSPLLAAFAMTLVTTAVRADPLAPVRAKNIELGALSGIVYYTVEPDGYRLVATLSVDGATNPFRVVATLASEQSMTLSAAREDGRPPVEVHFTRRGDQLLVDGGEVKPRPEPEREGF
jgi:hypothetical protein